MKRHETLSQPVSQVTIDFEGGLLDQFPDWMDIVRASVYGCGRPFKAIAADLDYSVSELSRRLSQSEDLEVPLKKFVLLIKATGDVRPVHWLIEQFIEDSEAKQRRAAQQLVKMLPQIQAALEAMK